MAYYNDQEDEELQQQGQPVTTGPEAGIISGQGTAPAASSPSKKPDNPGNFVGITQYLDANKQQSSKLGDQVSGKVGDTISQAQNQISTAGQGFKQEVDKNSISDLGNAQGQATDLVNKAQSGQGVSADESKRFQEISKANYQGPKTLVDSSVYQPTQKSLTEAQKQADLSKTEEGQSELLNQFYQKPNYSAGQQRLDSYLLGSKENRGKLEEARKKVDPLQKQFDDVSTQATEYAGKTATDTAAASKIAQDQLKAAEASQRGSIAQNLQKFLDDQTYLNNNVAQDITDTDLSEETAQRLGLDPGLRLFDADLKNYFNAASPTDVNQGNFANQDDYARYLALQELSGSDPSFDYLKKENQSQAGTAPKSGFDTQALMNYLGEKNQDYQKAYSGDVGKIGLTGNFIHTLNEIAGNRFGEENQGPAARATDVLNKISSSSPEQVEKTIIPWIRSMGGPLYPGVANTLEDSLAKWKKEKGYNNQITVGGQKPYMGK